MASSEDQKAGGGGRAQGDWVVLGVLLLLGLVLRVAYYKEINREPIFSAPISDAAFHDYWARALLSGDWTPPPGEPDPRIQQVPFLRPPGYPYFLAMTYALTGRSVNGARIVQMALGLLNCVLAYFLGRALGNRAIGLILAAFCALYWSFIYYEAELHAPVLIMTVSLCLLLVLHQWARRPVLWRALLAGVLLGVLALIRAESMLFVPVAAGWIWWVKRRRAGTALPQSRLLVPAAAFVLGAVVAIAPATIRNAVVAKEFCLISANGPINLYVGNNETSDGVTTRIPELPELTGSSGWSCFSYDTIVQSLSLREGRTLKYSDASAIFSRKARDFLIEHPGRFLGLTLKRAALFWGPEEVANNKAIKYEKANSAVLRWIPGFPFVFGASLMGLALLLLDRRAAFQDRKRARTAAKDLPSWVLVGLFVLTGFIALLPFLAAARFRTPYIPFIFLFGAYGLYRLGQMVREKDWKHAGFAAGGGVALLLLGSLSLAGYKTDQAWWHTDRALAYTRQGMTPQAEQEYNLALIANPGFIDAHVNLASLLAETGRADQALSHYRSVLQHRPTRVDVRHRLGAALIQMGRSKEAVAELREVVRQSPTLLEANFDLGRALIEVKDYATAMQIFDRLSNAMPEEPGVSLNKGIIRLRTGHPREAAEDFQRALQMKPDLFDGYLWLGQAYDGAGDREKSAQAFREAVRLRPDSPLPFIYLGAIEAKANHVDESITWFRRALAVDSDNFVAHYNLGGMLAMKGLRAEAATEFEAVLRLDPNNAIARQQLALLRGNSPN